jgi:hypothetical protein
MTGDFSTREKKWYQLSRQEIFEALNTQPEGLASAEATLCLERLGPSELGGEETTPLLGILLNQMWTASLSGQTLVLLLLAAFSVVVAVEVDKLLQRKSRGQTQ